MSFLGFGLKSLHFAGRQSQAQTAILIHVDMDVDELFEDVAHDAFLNEYFDSEDTAGDDPFMDDDCLWQPFSE